MEMTDKLTDIKTTTDEKQSSYFSDVFTPGETKEQLRIGSEVISPKSISGTIDTSDAGITKVDNEYTLNLPNPDGVIFSITIDGMSKVFKVGYFNNESTAYQTLLTEFQDWLGANYTISYLGSGNYKFVKYDGTTISKSSPNLVRTITLTGFDSISVIDVIIDGDTISLDGATHSGDAGTALDYLVTQLTGSTYYTTRSSNVLTIARIDGAIPSISKTQYNFYTYLVQAQSVAGNPSSTNVGGAGGTTPIQQDKFYLTFDGTPYTKTIGFANSFALESISYAFTNVLGTQTIRDQDTDGFIMMDYMYGQYGASYTKGSISAYGSPSGVDYWFYEHTLRKNDYSQITISGKTIDYILDGTLARYNIANDKLDYVETNHLADISVATATEITITLTLTSNKYLIPCAMKIKKITMSADSSGGRSEGVYELRDQSCTAHYSTTTAFVADKIFKTDASNYGNIAEINRRGGFTMQWTTNTSNKLTYTCT